MGFLAGLGDTLGKGLTHTEGGLLLAASRADLLSATEDDGGFGLLHSGFALLCDSDGASNAAIIFLTDTEGDLRGMGIGSLGFGLTVGIGLEEYTIPMFALLSSFLRVLFAITGGLVGRGFAAVVIFDSGCAVEFSSLRISVTLI